MKAKVQDWLLTLKAMGRILYRDRRNMLISWLFAGPISIAIGTYATINQYGSFDAIIFSEKLDLVLIVAIYLGSLVYYFKTKEK